MNYTKYRNQIQTGDLIQFAATDFISRIIRYKTKSAISHSTMAYWHVDPLGKTRLSILESVAFGLYPNYLSTRTAWYLPRGNMYWHRMRPEWREHGNRAASKMLEYVGTQYDFWSLIKQALVRVTLDPAKLFCSEAIVMAWKEIVGLPHDFIVPYPGEMTGDRLGVYEKERKLLI